MINNNHGDSGTWDWHGLDHAAWGSHLYWKSVERAGLARDARGDHFHQRPITLTKFGLWDWRGGMDPALVAESPGKKRHCSSFSTSFM